MKNMEKYPKTADALEAYAAYKGDSIGGVPFERWLKLEYVEPREPTLIEAAEAVIAARWRVSDLTNKLDDLIAVIDREKRKPVRNLDVYKTASDACKAFEKFCSGRPCDGCGFSGQTCTIAWLYAEADAAGKEEEK
mgnify:CR=1 FL=1